MKLEALTPPYLLPRTWYLVRRILTCYLVPVVSSNYNAPIARVNSQQPRVRDCRRRSSIEILPSSGARAGMGYGLHSNAYARVCGEEALG